MAEGRDEEAVAAYEEQARLHAWTVLPATTLPGSTAARALDRLGRHEDALRHLAEYRRLSR